MCVFYYCRTYYKAVRVGCYERRRAEACVEESAVCVCVRGTVKDMCYEVLITH